MNEEAIQYAYDLFTKDGYSDSLDEFKVLMSENPEALSHSYGLFKQDGYGDSLEDFTNLMGVEQKPQEEQPKQDISQEDVKKKRFFRCGTYSFTGARTYYISVGGFRLSFRICREQV